MRYHLPLHIAATRLDGVIRLYARMVQGSCHIRFEEGNCVINQAMEQAIASTVNDRAK
jgi:hypothetical protein